MISTLSRVAPGPRVSSAGDGLSHLDSLPRLTNQQWEDKKEDISELCITKGQSYEFVANKLRDEGYHVTPLIAYRKSMVESRVRNNWKLEKNGTTWRRNRDAIARKYRQRAEQGKITHGVEIQTAGRVQKYTKAQIQSYCARDGIKLDVCDAVPSPNPTTPPGLRMLSLSPELIRQPRTPHESILEQQAMAKAVHFCEDFWARQTSPALGSGCRTFLIALFKSIVSTSCLTSNSQTHSVIAPWLDTLYSVCTDDVISPHAFILFYILFSHPGMRAVIPMIVKIISRALSASSGAHPLLTYCLWILHESRDPMSVKCHLYRIREVTRNPSCRDVPYLRGLCEDMWSISIAVQALLYELVCIAMAHVSAFQELESDVRAPFDEIFESDLEILTSFVTLEQILMGDVEGQEQHFTDVLQSERANILTTISNQRSVFDKVTTVLRSTGGPYSANGIELITTTTSRLRKSFKSLSMGSEEASVRARLDMAQNTSAVKSPLPMV